MAYSSIAILALLVHLIINHDVLIKKDKNYSKYLNKSYRLFLYSVMLNYIMDALWGILYDALGATLRYSFQRALDHSDPESLVYGNQIPYIPRHSGSVSLAARWRLKRIKKK